MFNILKKDLNSKARIGDLNLPHGKVETPCFMPVGTAGVVKALKHEILEQLNCKLMLANTYHLYLRPGLEVIKRYGSLHKFVAWNKNLLTDSGGFQIFSLPSLRRVEMGGVEFKSHIDGSKHYFTPEKVIEMQELFESDIIMALDVCSPYGIDYTQALEYANITTSWANRSHVRYRMRKKGYEGILFLITQGNFYKDLRAKSTEQILKLNSPGIAIGGISVGEPVEKYLEILEYNASLIPLEKPRYVMGIGTPDYILEAIYYGIDIFDCVSPMRLARHGSLITDKGIIHIKRKEYELDTAVLEEHCACTLCTRYSKGFLRHLMKSNEMLGMILASEHNIFYMFRFIERIKEAIRQNDFINFKKKYLKQYKTKDLG